MSISDSGSPLIFALAIAEDRSSVGCSRRDAVNAEKYMKKSSRTAWMSSMLFPRCNSVSSPPNIS